jgi:hypothetical protein
MSKKTKNNNSFVMNTDWIFNGTIDAEQKEYVLLSYFQKMNKNLEEIRIYPMFTELSIHLGNIQTLLTQNKILYTDKKLTTDNDEIFIKDLKVKDIPDLTDEQFVEYQKIIKVSQPMLFDYFNIAKSLWSLAYDSVTVNVKRNKNNLTSKTGFYYTIYKDNLYVWRYTMKKIRVFNNQVRTDFKLIFSGVSDSTVIKVISQTSPMYRKNNENKLPIMEVVCHEMFPLNETLVPLMKRKVVSLIHQSTKIEKLLEENKIVENGVQ